jgi:hypothetical protein
MMILKHTRDRCYCHFDVILFSPFSFHFTLYLQGNMLGLLLNVKNFQLDIVYKYKLAPMWSYNNLCLYMKFLQNYVKLLLYSFVLIVELYLFFYVAISLTIKNTFVWIRSHIKKRVLGQLGGKWVERNHEDKQN